MIAAGRLRLWRPSNTLATIHEKSPLVKGGGRFFHSRIDVVSNRCREQTARKKGGRGRKPAPQGSDSEAREIFFHEWDIVDREPPPVQIAQRAVCREAVKGELIGAK